MNSLNSTKPEWQVTKNTKQTHCIQRDAWITCILSASLAIATSKAIHSSLHVSELLLSQKGIGKLQIFIPATYNTGGFKKESVPMGEGVFST